MDSELRASLIEQRRWLLERADEFERRGRAVPTSPGDWDARRALLEEAMSEARRMADAAESETERARWESVVAASVSERQSLGGDTATDEYHMALQYRFEASLIDQRLAEE